MLVYLIHTYNVTDSELVAFFPFLRLHLFLPFSYLFIEQFYKTDDTLLILSRINVLCEICVIESFEDVVHIGRFIIFWLSDEKLH